jgi:hypothetical protein
MHARTHAHARKPNLAFAVARLPVGIVVDNIFFSTAPLQKMDTAFPVPDALPLVMKV